MEFVKRHGWFRRWSVAAMVIAAAPTLLRADEIRVWALAPLPAEAEVVTLGDVAEIRCADATQAGQWAAIVVARAPRPGGKTTVQAEVLRAALREAGVNTAFLEINGASRCSVSRPAPEPVVKPAVAPVQKPVSPTPGKRQKIEAPAEVRADSADTLDAELRAFLSARLPRHDGKLEIRLDTLNPDDLRLGGPDHRFEIRPPVEPQAAGFGHFTLEVDVRKGDSESRTIVVRADVELLREVVTARRDVNRGEVLGPRDLKLEARRFDDLSKIGVTDLDAAAGQVCRRFVRAGEMLRAEGLESRPMVKRGEHVNILVRRNGFEIRTAGIAQIDGHMGTVIPVRREGTKRREDLIDAVVTGPGTVTVGGFPELAGMRMTKGG